MGRVSSIVCALTAAAYGTACGRLGFDSVAPDGANGPTLLACPSQTSFPIDAVPSALAVVGTPTGFAVIAVDGAAALRGWTYDISGTVLAPNAAGVVVDQHANGSLGMTARGAQIVVSSLYPSGAATGTAMYPLDSALGMRAPIARRDNVFAVGNPLAGDETGAIAFLTSESNKDVSARHVDLLGRDLDPAVRVIAGNEVPTSVVIAPAGSGYVVSYIASTSPAAARLVLLDASFRIVAGPVTANTTTSNATQPRAAWASRSSTYAVTWYEKDTSGDDDVWLAIYGPNLAPVRAATRIATKTHRPQITSDGTDFVLVWRDASTVPERLDAMRVRADGSVGPVAPVALSAGPAQFALIERLGQPVLAWVGTGVSMGTMLYFVALCS